MTKEHKAGISRRTLLKGAAALGVGAGAIYGLHKLRMFPEFSNSLPERPNDAMTMRWHPKTGAEISLLGFGCMRLPMLPGAKAPNGAEIDELAATQLIDHALAHGVNYFDSAWMYHRGASESFIGKALSRHPRESFNVATKMPTPRVNNLETAKKIFQTQLDKCQVEYFDFYQLHGIKSSEIYRNVYENMGVLDYLLEEKAKGRIKHLGWSFHGDAPALEYLLSRPVSWDYAMLQLNYHDLLHKYNPLAEEVKKYKFPDQPAPSKWMYEQVRDAGIPIVVMEPLLGGRLARLSRKALEPLREIRPESSAASWAFRYVGNLPGVLTVLSGMTHMEHLNDNLRTFSPLEPFSQRENEALNKALALYLNQKSIRCTTCGYCMPCPYGVDIPAVFSHFNHSLDAGNYPEDAKLEDYAASRHAYLADYDRLVPELRQASRCTGCGKCVAACPAMINIPEEMERLSKLTERLRNEEQA